MAEAVCSCSVVNLQIMIYVFPTCCLAGTLPIVVCHQTPIPIILKGSMHCYLVSHMHTLGSLTSHLSQKNAPVLQQCQLQLAMLPARLQNARPKRKR